MTKEQNLFADLNVVLKFIHQTSVVNFKEKHPAPRLVPLHLPTPNAIIFLDLQRLIYLTYFFYEIKQIVTLCLCSFHCVIICLQQRVWVLIIIVIIVTVIIIFTHSRKNITKMTRRWFAFSRLCGLFSFLEIITAFFVRLLQ